MRTFDAVNCGVQRKSGKREIVWKRTREGERFFLVRLQLLRLFDEWEKKKCQTVPCRVESSRVESSRVETRYRSRRSTCDLERDRIHPPYFEGSQFPARDHVVLGGGFHSPRLSRSTDRTKRMWNSSSTNKKMKVAHIIEICRAVMK